MDKNYPVKIKEEEEISPRTPIRQTLNRYGSAPEIKYRTEFRETDQSSLEDSPIEFDDSLVSAMKLTEQNKIGKGNGKILIKLPKRRTEKELEESEKRENISIVKNTMTILIIYITGNILLFLILEVDFTYQYFSVGIVISFGIAAMSYIILFWKGLFCCMNYLCCSCCLFWKWRRKVKIEEVVEKNEKTMKEKKKEEFENELRECGILTDTTMDSGLSSNDSHGSMISDLASNISSVGKQDSSEFVNVCIPCYQEDYHTLRATFDSVVDSAFKAGINYSVVVIQDGYENDNRKECFEGFLRIMSEYDFMKVEHGVGDVEEVFLYDSVNEEKFELQFHSKTFKTVNTKINVIHILKRFNRSKLHSLQLYFTWLCQWKKMEEMLKPVAGTCGKFCLFVDADTQFEPKAPLYLRRKLLSDPCSGACCGYMEARQATPASWFLNLAIAHEFGISHLMKLAESFLKMVVCIPGAFCMFRTSVLTSRISKEFCQMDPRTFFQKLTQLLGDDRYLTYMLIKNGKSTLVEPLARCRTFTPHSITSFVVERRRWGNSTLSCQLLLFRDFLKVSLTKNPYPMLVIPRLIYFCYSVVEYLFNFLSVGLFMYLLTDQITFPFRYLFDEQTFSYIRLLSHTISLLVIIYLFWVYNIINAYPKQMSKFFPIISAFFGFLFNLFTVFNFCYVTYLIIWHLTREGFQFDVFWEKMNVQFVILMIEFAALSVFVIETIISTIVFRDWKILVGFFCYILLVPLYTFILPTYSFANLYDFNWDRKGGVKQAAVVLSQKVLQLERKLTSKDEEEFHLRKKASFYEDKCSELNMSSSARLDRERKKNKRMKKKIYEIKHKTRQMHHHLGIFSSSLLVFMDKFTERHLKVTKKFSERIKIATEKIRRIRLFFDDKKFCSDKKVHKIGIKGTKVLLTEDDSSRSNFINTLKDQPLKFGEGMGLLSGVIGFSSLFEEQQKIEEPDKSGDGNHSSQCKCTECVEEKELRKEMRRLNIKEAVSSVPVKKKRCKCIYCIQREEDNREKEEKLKTMRFQRRKRSILNMIRRKRSNSTNSARSNKSSRNKKRRSRRNSITSRKE